MKLNSDLKLYVRSNNAMQMGEISFGPVTVQMSVDYDAVWRLWFQCECGAIRWETDKCGDCGKSLPLGFCRPAFSWETDAADYFEKLLAALGVEPLTAQLAGSDLADTFAAVCAAAHPRRASEDVAAAIWRAGVASLASRYVKCGLPAKLA